MMAGLLHRAGRRRPRYLLGLSHSPRSLRCLCTPSSSSSSSTPPPPTFADQASLRAATRRALSEVLSLTTMTEVQSRTLAPALEGLDVLGRARTGTGKTLAFLVPAVEAIEAVGSVDADRGRSGGVEVLVVSPTRELALQIKAEGEALLSRREGSQFDRVGAVQVVFGGTPTRLDRKRLNRQTPNLLVATPGRLLDHVRNLELDDGRTFQSLLRSVKVLVLDEADMLMKTGGFRDEVGGGCWAVGGAGAGEEGAA